MSSWFKKISQPVMPQNEGNGIPSQNNIRYRATFPIDVWIEDTGDEEQNINIVYKMINDCLNNGGLSNHQLHPSDIERYDSLI